MAEITIPVTALLFRGTVLYAFGLAAFVFSVLPAEMAGPLIRRAFPYFYLFVLGTSAFAAAPSVSLDPFSGRALVAITATDLVARQVMVPAINRATDAGQRTRFRTLHTLSVLIILAHIGAADLVIARVAGAGRP